jgi:hypothetical protein
MRVFATIAVTLVLLTVGATAWYKISYPTYTYRYRITVEVLVDGQVKSGSSVIEISVNKQPKIGSAPAQFSRVNGEAVFVDLGDGRNLVALLASGASAKNVDYPYNVVPTLFHLAFDDRDLAKFSRLHGGRNVPTNFLPTFVTFADVSDPGTARVINPDELALAFGRDARLQAVRVEITDAPVTHGIERSLPFLRTRVKELSGIIDNMPPRFQPHFHLFKRS